MSTTFDPLHARDPTRHRRPPQPLWLTLVVTWFGAGLSPVMPGTAGSLAALPFAAAIAWFGAPWMLVPAALLVFAIGVWASDVYCKRAGVKDPGLIVIDEVAAQWLTLSVAPVAFWPYVIGFVLFRIFDMTKPWPVSWADRHVGGGFGVMVDDLLAGAYSTAALYLVLTFLL
ncbi:phosphatidylglycerophosphatase A [Caenispirillum salinarum]|uniref:phosphatidylglycerophosphatase A family protein n=1 Tax=Caenispirillum salinarum TaxID=859058 RepID=UPI00384A5A42